MDADIQIYIDHPARTLEDLSCDLQKIIKILDAFDSVNTRVFAKPDHESEELTLFDSWSKFNQKEADESQGS